ncbi:MAG: sigma 54-interacting transcriptional regulator, partial [Spirochaetaceae bacterium]|nr:sigma 54-interacting transcriptional regulator [Spirochaetaceae bacterium]
MLESEIFGDDSSNQKNEGSLKISSNGTIFFDEVGFLPLNLQKMLLSYIQSGECNSRIVA